MRSRTSINVDVQIQRTSGRDGLTIWGSPRSCTARACVRLPLRSILRKRRGMRPSTTSRRSWWRCGMRVTASGVCPMRRGKQSRNSSCSISRLLRRHRRLASRGHRKARPADLHRVSRAHGGPPRGRVCLRRGHALFRCLARMCSRSGSHPFRSTRQLQVAAAGWRADRRPLRTSCDTPSKPAAQLRRVSGRLSRHQGWARPGVRDTVRLGPRAPHVHESSRTGGHGCRQPRWFPSDGFSGPGSPLNRPQGPTHRGALGRYGLSYGHGEVVG